MTSDRQEPPQGLIMALLISERSVQGFVFFNVTHHSPFCSLNELQPFKCLTPGVCTAPVIRQGLYREAGFSVEATVITSCDCLSVFIFRPISQTLLVFYKQRVI